MKRHVLVMYYLDSEVYVDKCNVWMLLYQRTLFGSMPEPATKQMAYRFHMQVHKWKFITKQDVHVVFNDCSYYVGDLYM